MPPENDPTVINPPATDPNNPPAGDVRPPPTGGGREPAMLQVPSNTMRDLKAKEREKGKKARDLELNATAQALGYKDHADLLAAAQRKFKAGAAPANAGRPAQPPARTRPADDADPDDAPAPSGGRAAPGDNRSQLRAQRERERLLEERRQANRKLAKRDKENAQLKSRIAQTETHGRLLRTAMQAGIVGEENAEYAVGVLLRKHVAGMTEAQVGALNEREFFAALRAKQPYLFTAAEPPAEAETAPATPAGETKTPPLAPPPTRPAGRGPPAGGDNGKPPSNALKMTPEQFRRGLLDMGIDPPS